MDPSRHLWSFRGRGHCGVGGKGGATERWGGCGEGEGDKVCHVWRGRGERGEVRDGGRGGRGRGRERALDRGGRGQDRKARVGYVHGRIIAGYFVDTQCGEHHVPRSTGSEEYIEDTSTRVLQSVDTWRTRQNMSMSRHERITSDDGVSLQVLCEYQPVVDTP